MPRNGQKLFSTVDDQVTLLRDEKGIQINDEAFAKDILFRIGYFPLMGGYKHLFRIPLTKNHKTGTTFEEIFALYAFDADLRELVFRYLLQIERHIRSLMSYYFTKLHGEAQSEYLNASNYNNSQRNNSALSKLIRTKSAGISVQSILTKWSRCFQFLPSSEMFVPTESDCLPLRRWIL